MIAALAALGHGGSIFITKVDIIFPLRRGYPPLKDHFRANNSSLTMVDKTKNNSTPLRTNELPERPTNQTRISRPITFVTEKCDLFLMRRSQQPEPAYNSKVFPTGNAMKERKKNEGDAERTESNVIPLLLPGFTFLVVGGARFYD